MWTKKDEEKRERLMYKIWDGKASRAEEDSYSDMCERRRRSEEEIRKEVVVEGDTLSEELFLKNYPQFTM